MRDNTTEIRLTPAEFALRQAEFTRWLIDQDPKDLGFNRMMAEEGKKWVELHKKAIGVNLEETKIIALDGLVELLDQPQAPVPSKPDNKRRAPLKVGKITYYW